MLISNSDKQPSSYDFKLSKTDSTGTEKEAQTACHLQEAGINHLLHRVANMYSVRFKDLLRDPQQLLLTQLVDFLKLENTAELTTQLGSGGVLLFEGVAVCDWARLTMAALLGSAGWVANLTLHFQVLIPNLTRREVHTKVYGLTATGVIGLMIFM